MDHLIYDDIYDRLIISLSVDFDKQIALYMRQTLASLLRVIPGGFTGVAFCAFIPSILRDKPHYWFQGRLLKILSGFAVC